MSSRLPQNEIQKLLKNIVDVLKTYTVPELNDYLLTVINKKEDTHESQNYILELVCETYNISHRALIYSKSNQRVTKSRQVAFCLLHFTLGLSIRHIAQKIFHFKHHSTVALAIKIYKNLDMNIKPDRQFKESIEMLKEKVINKLNNLENK